MYFNTVFSFFLSYQDMIPPDLDPPPCLIPASCEGLELEFLLKFDHKGKTCRAKLSQL